jgi:hypothetical protein
MNIIIYKSLIKLLIIILFVFKAAQTLLIIWNFLPIPEFVIGSYPAYWNPALVGIGCD